MPAKISDEELKSLVADGRVKSISLDTNVFYKNGYRFNEGILDTLKQFKNSRFELLLSEIVVDEIKSDLIERHGEFLHKWQAMRKWLAHYPYLDEQSDALNDEIDELPEAAKWAWNVMNRFMLDTNTQLVSNTHVDLQDVISRYFNSEPPFHLKKKEFPDAIALLSLEAWAGSPGGIIVVSDDEDWQGFCEASDKPLYFVKDLATALNIINETQIDRDNRAMMRMETLQELLHNGELSRRAKEALIKELKEKAIPRASRESPAFVADIIRVDVVVFDIGNFSPIRDDETAYSTIIDMAAVCKLMANFEFYDGTLKHHFGKGQFSQVKQFEGMVLVNVDDSEVQVEVILNKEELSIDYGRVEPDAEPVDIFS